MARHRTIDLDEILNAAERVIVEHGAANFTLDAVAASAGVSKGSVMRDCATKQELIRAVVARGVERYRALLDEAQSASEGTDPPSRIAAHIQVLAGPLHHQQRQVTFQLVSSLPTDKQLSDLIGQFYGRELNTVSVPGLPSGSLLAFLALEGIRAIEMFCNHEWHGSDRDRLLSAIARLAETDIGRDAVRVLIEQAVDQDAITIPQQALIRDAGGNLQVYVVQEDNTVDLRTVVVGRSLGNRYVISEGLEAGDRVVVEGFQKVGPCAPVNAEEWQTAAAEPATEQNNEDAGEQQ